jgi:hypothetical protein
MVEKELEYGDSRPSSFAGLSVCTDVPMTAMANMAHGTRVSSGSAGILASIRPGHV